MNQLQRAGDDGLTTGDVKRIGAALDASIAPNTAKAYRAALDRFARWLDGRPATDITVAAYVAALMDDGYAPAACAGNTVASAARHHLDPIRPQRSGSLGSATLTVEYFGGVDSGVGNLLASWVMGEAAWLVTPSASRRPAGTPRAGRRPRVPWMP